MITTQQNQAFHPIHNYQAGVFNTVSGKLIDLLHPDPMLIDIKDIGSALSKICRFGGHCSEFYSVAQHSVLVAAMAPPELKKEALLHDAAEAYCGDVIKPLKNIVGTAYDVVEDRFHQAINLRFDLKDDDDTKAAIKVLDMDALSLEHLAFQQGCSFEFMLACEAGDMMVLENLAWNPVTAFVEFIKAYRQIFNLKSF